MISNRPIISSLLAAGLLCAAVPATAGSITVNSLMFADSEEQWDTYTYIAKDTVKSLNETGSRITELGHFALNLDNKSSTSRMVYALTAGHLNYRFQVANTIFFGHEYVHFQHAHRLGLTNHSFVSDDDGSTISKQDAYINIFLTGGVGGPATSSSGSTFDPDLYASEGITTALAGANWQTAYSEQWIRDAATLNSKNVFDQSDFFFNRSYMMSYALHDYDAYKDGGATNGDLYKFANNLNLDGGNEDTLKKIVGISLLANLMSPRFIESVTDYVDYVVSGDTEITQKYITTSAGGITWDIPQYLNPNSLTLAPTIYLKVNDSLATSLGADRMLLSASYETPVLGDDDAEIRLTATTAWNHIETDFAVTAGSNGQFYELMGAYNISDSMAVTGGAVFGDGDTLRGKRNMPTGNSAAWIGARYTF